MSSIAILDATEIDRMRRAGRAAAATLRLVGARLRPGVTGAQIDAWVREDTAARGGRPSQLGYHGFPAAVCVSRNDVVCHGIPTAELRLEAGDIVNIDVTTEVDGYHGDTSATFLIRADGSQVGAPGNPGPGRLGGRATTIASPVTAEAEALVATARRCRDAGIAVVRDGAHLGDVGAAIQAEAARARCSVVTELGGHGIGREMHLPPHVHHVGTRGRGLRLRAGMAFTIEPMINRGGPDVVVDADGWTVRTLDGSLSAQFEHTVLVTAQGCEILTRC